MTGIIWLLVTGLWAWSCSSILLKQTIAPRSISDWYAFAFVLVVPGWAMHNVIDVYTGVTLSVWLNIKESRIRWSTINFLTSFANM